MPNWCHNKLTVTHDDDVMLDMFVNAYMAGTMCSQFLPQPLDVQDVAGWRVANWGQKWDLGCGRYEEYGLKPTVVGNEASVSFYSAWSPPLGVYERLVVLGFDVQASYFEPGMGFAGTWSNGEDNLYEGDIEDLPASLVNEYGYDVEEMEEEKM